MPRWRSFPLVKPSRLAPTSPAYAKESDLTSRLGSQLDDLFPMDLLDSPSPRRLVTLLQLPLPHVPPHHPELNLVSYKPFCPVVAGVALHPDQASNLRLSTDHLAGPPHQAGR